MVSRTRLVLSVFVLLWTSLVMTSQLRAQPAEEVSELRNEPDSVGYLTGWKFGVTVEREGADLNHAILIAGVRDALEYKQPRIDQTSITRLMDSVRNFILMLKETRDTAGDLAVRIYGTSTSHGPDQIETRNDSLSYSIGQRYGMGVKARKLNVNPVTVVRGLSDYLGGKESAISEEGIIRLEVLAQKREQAALAAKDQMLQDAEAFLAQNAQREGVTVLPEGLQYEVVEEGSGESPDRIDTAYVHMEVSRLGDDEPFFNSNRDSGTPILVPIASASKDFATMLTDMKVGGTRMLYASPKSALVLNVLGSESQTGVMTFKVTLHKIGRRSQ